MNKKNIFAVALAIAALLPVCISCSEHADEETPMNETKKQTVSIQTRTADGTPAIDWPLTLYAFNSSGNLVTSTTANDDNDATKLTLGKGGYTLVALAGTTSLTLPETPTLNTDIGIPNDGILTKAPQMSTTQITVASDNMECPMTLSYPVAKISLTLSDMPTRTQTITATLSNLYGSIAFDGTKSGTSSPTLTLTKQRDDSWTSSTLHVLPSSGPLTLNIQTDDESFSIRTNAELEAGKSYNLKGQYKGEVEISVSLTTLGWTEGNDIDFELKDEDTNNDNETPDNTLIVSAIPEAMTLCNGHFVAAVTGKTGTSATLLLMSLDEWECIPNTASTFITPYTEAGLTGWRIPTADEMKEIATTAGAQQNIANVISLLTEANGKALTASKLYLCEEGTKTYIMGASDSANAADADSQTSYKLRAVKTVTAIVGN